MRSGTFVVGPGAVAPGPAVEGVDAGRGRRVDALVAGAALPLTGLWLPVASGATTATAVVIALAPVWLRSVTSSRPLGVLLSLSLLAVPTGLLVAAAAGPAAGRTVDPAGALAMSLLLLTAMGSVGLLVWARTVLPLQRVALLLGGGMLIGGLLASPDSPNPWKYALSFPVTIVAMALVSRRRPQLAVPLLLVLATVGVLFESRSYAAFCVLTAAMVLSRPPSGRRLSRLRVLAALGAAGFTAYQLGTELLLDGFLGRTLQERSVEQVENAGSLIAGGRPEWAATAALFRDNPLGFGLGAVPTGTDLRSAREGLDTVGISGSNGYVTNYMFGDAFRLHAVVADLWASFSVVGVALGVVLVALVVRALATALTRRPVSPLIVFACLMALWWLAFGPVYSDLPTVAMVLGLVLPVGGPDDGP